MNKGIQLSKGDWLYFLGCDDEIYDKDVLKSIVAKIRPNIKWLIGRTLITEINRPSLGIPITSWKRYLFCSIPHQGCFYHKSIFDKLNYDESFILSADYKICLLYTSPSPRDATLSRMPSSA